MLTRADLVLWCWANQQALFTDRITKELIDALSKLLRAQGVTVLDPPAEEKPR